MAYVFLARGYFSLVRRIKAGTFISNTIFYRIFDALGNLAMAPRFISIIMVLVVINGALVFALFKLDGYEIAGIPLVYVLVPIIFVLETISFISWVIKKGNEEYEDEDVEDEALDEEEAPAQIQAAAPEIPAGANDWEHMDLGVAVDEAISGAGDTEEPVEKEDEGQTVMLPKDELESLLAGGEVVRDSATSFDFIQLNKDIRKLHRPILKENGVAVTLRTPDKPIVLEMNKEDMWKAISMIYDNLEQYAEADSRVYAEMYTQDGKLIYIVKNAVKDEALAEAKAIVAPGAELTGGLKTAKEIVEKNHGKFVVAMDGNIFKTGILMAVSQE